jgi:tetratricopeptide (TPR) repeat protein
VYNNRGFTYFKKGDYDRAIEDYTMAINLNLIHPIVYKNRRAAYIMKGDQQRANEDFIVIQQLSKNYCPISQPLTK